MLLPLVGTLCGWTSWLHPQHPCRNPPTLHEGVEGCYAATRSCTGSTPARLPHPHPATMPRRPPSPTRTRRPHLFLTGTMRRMAAACPPTDGPRPTFAQQRRNEAIRTLAQGVAVALHSCRATRGALPRAGVGPLHRSQHTHVECRQHERSACRSYEPSAWYRGTGASAAHHLQTGPSTFPLRRPSWVACPAPPPPRPPDTPPP